MHLISVFYALIALVISPLLSRSIHRIARKKTPCIITKWSDSSRTYRLYHENLEPAPFFSYYNLEYLNKHRLPTTSIQPRDPQQSPISGVELNRLLNELVETLQKSDHVQSILKDFIILKQRDYNPRRHAGLIILKFKQHPFVVKLFMETPESITSPFSKGFEQSVFFIMGGGVNRHLSGFSRIPNAEAIRTIIQNEPRWRDIFEVPRKWFWLPRHARTIEISSLNLGPEDAIITIPAVYAVICDAIEPSEAFHIFNKSHRKRALDLCHTIGIRVDPHIDNFMVEWGTGKLILVDTEHFPSMVGLREPLPFTNYVQWYLQLCLKCATDGFFRPKHERRRYHAGSGPHIVPCTPHPFLNQPDAAPESSAQAHPS